MSQETKNLIFACLGMVVVMAGWHFLYEAPRQEEAKVAALMKKQEPSQDQTAPAASATNPVATKTQESTPKASMPQAANDILTYIKTTSPGVSAIAQDEILFENKELQGSISLKGAVLDTLSLKKYKETTAEDADQVKIWTTGGHGVRTLARVGWSSPDTDCPTLETQWSTQSKLLTPKTPLTLTWTNKSGVKFIRTIKMDEAFLFTIIDEVENNSDRNIRLTAEGTMNRVGTPESSGFAVLHEGPIGYFNNKLKEISYDDVAENPLHNTFSTGGWIAFSDQYWLTALIPAQAEPFKPVLTKTTSGDEDLYTYGYRLNEKIVSAGSKTQTTHHCYGGAKILKTLDKYEETLGISHFDLAVDFGWFYFITKPLFKLLNWLYGFLGNFGIAILLMTVIVKILFLPIANKSYKSMGKMKALQPKIQALQERFKDDKMKMNEEMMKLYKKEKVNPVSGCLPMLLQIPVFFSLYKVLFISIEMRHAPFFGWIQDLSAPDPTSVFNLFGLIPFDPPSFLMIGLWPLVMGGTMWLQQKLSPTPGDPAQQKAFMIMPVVFTYLFASFPAGLVIYWTWNNLLSIAQQSWIMKQNEASKKGE